MSSAETTVLAFLSCSETPPAQKEPELPLPAWVKHRRRRKVAAPELQTSPRLSGYVSRGWNIVPMPVQLPEPLKPHQLLVAIREDHVDSSLQAAV